MIKKVMTMTRVVLFYSFVQVVVSSKKPTWFLLAEMICGITSCG